jgi:hypothetical protein
MAFLLRSWTRARPPKLVGEYSSILKAEMRLCGKPFRCCLIPVMALGLRQSDMGGFTWPENAQTAEQARAPQKLQAHRRMARAFKLTT